MDLRMGLAAQAHCTPVREEGEGPWPEGSPLAYSTRACTALANVQPTRRHLGWLARAGVDPAPTHLGVQVAPAHAPKFEEPTMEAKPEEAAQEVRCGQVRVRKRAGRPGHSLKERGGPRADFAAGAARPHAASFYRQGGHQGCPNSWCILQYTSGLAALQIKLPARFRRPPPGVAGPRVAYT